MISYKYFLEFVKNTIYTQGELMKKEFTYKLINKADTFIDTFIVPMCQTGHDLVTESEYLKPLVKWRENHAKNKIDLFFYHLAQKSEKDKLNFIQNLKENEKVFFVETVNKIIDLDDSLQNYMMSCLVTQYKQNGDLNYYEKKLYYNINSFSEDDFKIYFCIYKKHIENMKTQGYLSDSMILVNEQYTNKNIIYTSLLRFSSIGILLLKSKSEREEEIIKYDHSDMKIKTIEYFEITDYSKHLFNYLEIYFKDNDNDCKELLHIPKSEFSTLSWI